jgi:ATP-dependent helicase/nuclease subunit B
VVPGAAAEAALASEIRRLQAGDPLSPVWLVVPCPIVGLSLRRRLAQGGAFAAVRFSPLGVLVQKLGSVAAVRGREPLGPVARRAAARVALGEVPGVFSSVARHPATEASMASVYGDLRRASAAELDVLAAPGGRGADVVKLVRAMRRLLAGDYYDTSDLIEAAVAQLDGDAGGELLLEIGSVVVYLPEPLGPDESSLLVALARRLEVLVLAGRTGDQLADRGVDRWVESLAGGFDGPARPAARLASASPGPASASPGPASLASASPGPASASPGPASLAPASLAPASPFPGVPAAAPPAATFDSLVSAPDEDVEVREAVRRLVLHAEAGGDLGRCIVTFPDGVRAAEVGRRLGEQLRVAGLPSSGSARMRLSDTPHAQLLTGLVRLAMPAQPGHELDRGQVVAWLGRGPIQCGQGLTRGLATVEAEGCVPVGAWDRCTRAAGVLSGITQWRDRLRSYAAGFGAVPAAPATPAAPTPAAPTPTPTPTPSPATPAAPQAVPRSARTALDLLEFIERLYSLTTAAASAESWEALRAWAEHAVEEMLEQPDETAAALVDALGELDLLDRVDPLDRLQPSERLRRFALSLEVAFSRPAGDRGRFGVGPVVGPLSAVAGASADLLLVLGCREGELPGPERDDPLVSRTERAGIEALAHGEPADEVARRQLVSLLVAAESSSASFSRVDVRAGRVVYPSRWTSELFAGRLTEIPSFAGSIRRVTDGVASPADVTDLELASLPTEVARRSPTWLEILDADYRRRRAAGLHRRDGGLSAFAGYVPETGLVADAWSIPLSATGLEDFAACPFRFFVQRKLGVKVIEAPERLVTIDPRDRGTLMHEVLEGFFRGDGGDGPVPELDAEALGRLRELATAEFERVERLGKTGKAIFWHTERARILRDLERYAARDIADAVAEGRVRLYAELDFGGDDRPVATEVAGRRVAFRGRIDRVDRTGDGRLVVVDYKSGKSEGFREIRKDPLGQGRHLQLPIYARAAVAVLGPESSQGGPVRAEYRFVQATAGYEVIPVELTSELEVALDAALETFVATIDAGCFPPRPGAPDYGLQYTNCRYCDFDGLCTTDRAEQWERASSDQEMTAYAELVTGGNE